MSDQDVTEPENPRITDAPETLFGLLSSHRDILLDILEAVRALKPASDPIPSELELQDKLQRAEHLVEMWRGVARAKEVERLQKKVADQALTIATLKDELAQTRHLLEEERALTAATTGPKP
jgi:hypothetical protein